MLQAYRKNGCYYKVSLVEVKSDWSNTGRAPNFRAINIVGNMSMSLYENTESSLKIHRRKT